MRRNDVRSSDVRSHNSIRRDSIEPMTGSLVWRVETRLRVIFPFERGRATDTAVRLPIIRRRSHIVGSSSLRLAPLTTCSRIFGNLACGAVRGIPPKVGRFRCGGSGGSEMYYILNAVLR